MGELYQLVVALAFMGWNLYLTLSRGTTEKAIVGLEERMKEQEGKLERFHLEATTKFVTQEALKDLKLDMDKRFDKLEAMLERKLKP